MINKYSESPNLSELGRRIHCQRSKDTVGQQTPGAEEGWGETYANCSSVLRCHLSLSLSLCL